MMKKHYYIFGITLIGCLSITGSYAANQPQSQQQITSSSFTEYLSEELQDELQPISQLELLEQKGSSSKSAKLVPQKCWTARKCKGKVLNNQNSHQCKTSGGKSWNDNQGQCFNL